MSVCVCVCVCLCVCTCVSVCLSLSRLDHSHTHAHEQTLPDAKAEVVWVKVVDILANVSIEDRGEHRFQHDASPDPLT